MNLVRPRTHCYVLAIVLLSAFLISFWTLRPGHIWGDDFAMYLLQAHNFADGQPHRPTGYLYNPSVPEVGPAEYPPVVPLILAGVYKVRGLDLPAMKLALLTAFVIALIPLYFLINDFLKNPYWSGVAVLSFALNPVIVAADNLIGTDLVLLAFLFANLYLVQLVYVRHVNVTGNGPGRDLITAFVCGVLAYLAYATRSIGIVLALVPPAVDLLIRRRITRFTVAMLAVVGGCLTLQTFLLKPGSGETSILKMFLLSPKALFQGGFSYLREARIFVPVGWTPASFLFYGLILALACLGTMYWRQRREGIILLVFGTLYSLVIGLYPASPTRYVYPLIPVVIILVSGGAIWLSRRYPPSRYLLGLALAVYFAGSANAILHMDRSPIREGIGDPQFQAICNYISRNSSKDAIFVFAKPRLLALMTGRPASIPVSTDVGEFLRSIGAEYVLIADNIPEEPLAPEAPLRSLVEAKGSPFQRVMTIGSYRLYRRI
jgi:hypothetical protein